MEETPRNFQFHSVWRGDFTNSELNALHSAAFEYALEQDKGGHDWRSQVKRWSLGWVTAREDQHLIGFVNVAWDGNQHAFVLDTVVASAARRRGVARALVGVAQREAAAAGCEWLHVDFVEELKPFYLETCAFTQTAAGLLRLVPETKTP